jgi:uncharacterized membrane protein YbaN (DUF454 family)
MRNNHAGAKLSVRRVLLLGLGGASLAVGIVGALVPVLPTTPFVLIGAGCFGASSPRLYRRLADTRYFGEYIRAYREKAPISTRTRTISLVWLWSALLLSAILCGSWPVRGILAVVGIAVSVHILTIRRGRKASNV